MPKHRKNSRNRNTVGEFLGEVDINEVLRFLSALLSKVDCKQQEENSKLMELMKDERFENIIAEIRKDYKKED
ncbi:MAG: hypothetical protein ACM3X7_10390 [Solirubrobacterales bacterium]